MPATRQRHSLALSFLFKVRQMVCFVSVKCRFGLTSYRSSDLRVPNACNIFTIIRRLRTIGDRSMGPAVWRQHSGERVSQDGAAWCSRGIVRSESCGSAKCVPFVIRIFHQLNRFCRTMPKRIKGNSSIIIFRTCVYLVWQLLRQQLGAVVERII